jgi:hypothetical protein
LLYHSFFLGYMLWQFFSCLKVWDSVMSEKFRLFNFVKELFYSLYWFYYVINLNRRPKSIITIWQYNSRSI